MPEVTARPIRGISRMEDANGNGVIFAVDCDAIAIRRGGKEILLGPKEQDEFIRRFFAAQRETDAWTAEYGGRR